MRKAVFFLLWCCVSWATAQDQGHVRFLKFQADYRINPDATYTALVEVAYVLLTEAALVDSGKPSISYSGKLEEVEVLHAYTRKKDGLRIDVAPQAIQRQEGQLADGYDISYADRRKVMITLPQLEVGDTAVYRYRLLGKVPIFPGHFYVSHAYAREHAWDAVDLSIDAPSSLALQIEAVKLAALPVLERNGRRIYRWQARNLPVVHPEPASVDVFPSIPHLIATTFGSWQQLAAAYDARARPKAAATPAVTAMAERITRNVKEPREQARLIYTWVATNIRYVATWIGADGWVPQRAESVLIRRYGDCKDHAVLLQALLAAKGIASSTVLINRDKTSYSLPSVPLPSFNHVIVYIPAFGLYVDSTNGSTTPFGILPLSDMDKPVIHTAGFSHVRRTPMPKASGFASSRTMRMTLFEDGAAIGELIIDAFGPAAIEMRELRRSIGQRKEEEWVRDLLDSQNFEGTGQISFEDSSDGSMIRTRLTVWIENYLAVSENGAIPLAPLLVGPIAFDSLRTVYKRSTRTLPFWCPGWTLDDHYEFHLPAQFRLILPSGRQLEEEGFSYQSRYALSGRMLTATRRLSIERATMACRPAEYPVRKSIVSRIERDLRAQVIYQTDEHPR